MSLIRLSGNASGTGTITLASPNTNSDFTLNLPAANGTVNTSGATNEVPAGTASAPAIYPTGDTNTGIFFPAADTIAFTEGGTESARFDSAGNFGLGVTPSVWNTAGAGRALQMPNSSSRASAFGTWYGAVGLLNDCYYGTDNNFKYYSGGAVGTYEIAGGAHRWFTAPSGTANATISLTQAMTLDASGRLGIGATSGSFPLVVSANGGTDVALVSGIAGGAYFGAVGAKPIVFQNNDTERARIDSSGNLLVGTTSGSFSSIVGGGGYALGVSNSTTNNNVMLIAGNSSSNAQNYVVFARAGTATGTIYFNGSTVSYNPTSDRRLKDNIQPMTDGLARVMKLKPVTYNWKSNGAVDDGFIAQDLQEIPEFAQRVNPVGEQNGEMHYGVDYMRFVSVLTAAIQELKAIVDQQAQEIAALKGQA